MLIRPPSSGRARGPGRGRCASVFVAIDFLRRILSVVPLRADNAPTLPTRHADVLMLRLLRATHKSAGICRPDFPALQDSPVGVVGMVQGARASAHYHLHT